MWQLNSFDSFDQCLNLGLKISKSSDFKLTQLTGFLVKFISETFRINNIMTNDDDDEILGS